MQIEQNKTENSRVNSSEDVSLDFSDKLSDDDLEPLSTELKNSTAQLVQQVHELYSKHHSLERELEDKDKIIEDLRNRLKCKEDEIDALSSKDHGQVMIDVKGSTWDDVILPKLKLCALLEKENADLRGSANRLPDSSLKVVTRELSEARKKLEASSVHDSEILKAFRMVKYELYAAEFDLLGYTLEVKGPSRNCMVRSAWHLDDPSESFEFIYSAEKKRYVDVAWTDTVQKYATQYAYWVQERQSLAGFLTAVFMENFEKLGPPPGRPVNNSEQSLD